MSNFISVGQFMPYTLQDLSVVIPQASWHQKRISWFIPQFIQATPPEVIQNTIVAYDGDEYTKKILDQYYLKGMVVTPDWSTYKMMAGFKAVKTRLCVRIHNDTYFPRNDWAQSLINQFNASYSPQIIGAYHPSGILMKSQIDALLQRLPFFKSIYQDLLFDNEAVGSPFLSAFLTACQTYVFQSLYPIVMEINDNKMDKEDCLLAVLALLFNIRIANWINLDSFAIAVGKPGEFEEDTVKQLPTNITLINESNKQFMAKAEFKEVIT